MSAALPRLLVVLCRVLVPARHRTQVLADLADDYRDICAARRPWAARWWLWREAASVVTAFPRASARGVFDHVPVAARDLRLVARGLRRAPLAALAASGTLAIGFVAVLVAAGLARPLLFRPVSAIHGAALRRVAVVDPAGRPAFRLSYLEVEEVRRHLDGAARLAAVNLQPIVLRARGADLQTMVEVVDDGHAALVSGPMVIGRPLVASDDRPGAPPVVVIGEALWRRQFASDPHVVGQTVDLNRMPFTIVGVSTATSSTGALGGGVDAWAPLAQADALLSAGWRTDPAARWFSMFALPTHTVAEVDARLALAATALTQRLPDAWRDRRLRTDDGTVLTGRQRTGAATLVAVLTMLAALILSVGAANVAGMLLARAAAGERQTAVHLALGAGRGAIARRLVLEGMALGLGGGALALGGYAWARTALAEVALLPTLALRLELPLDSGLLGGLALGATLAGAALAAGPAAFAVRGARVGVAGIGDSRVVADARVSPLRRWLLAAQLSLSFALVVGAGLAARSLSALELTDVGFVPQGLVALDFDLEPVARPSQPAPSLRAALALTATVADVRAVAMSNRAPIDASTPVVAVRRGRDAEVVAEVTMNLVTEAYFQTVGLPVLEGRAFTTEECEVDADVAIVNETLGRRLWPGESPLGRALVAGADQRLVRIIGVAADSKYRSLAESGQSHLYRPTRPGFGLTLLARTGGDPRAALAALQRVLDRAGPGLVGFFPRTFADHLAIELLPTRAAAATASGLGLVALLLSLMAVYGLVSWFVERRRREIGVRLAIGASPTAIVALVVREAVVAAVPGLTAGVGLAIGLGSLVRSSLHGVGVLDPISYLVGLAALSVVVAAAAVVPSWRASRVDPVVVLRDR